MRLGGGKRSAEFVFALFSKAGSLIESGEISIDADADTTPTLSIGAEKEPHIGVGPSCAGPPGRPERGGHARGGAPFTSDGPARSQRPRSLAASPIPAPQKANFPELPTI
jgi:hypothetical protein